MSVKVDWTCDWCGKHEHRDTITSRPLGWIKLIRNGPVWGDLCEKCVVNASKVPVINTMVYE